MEEIKVRAIVLKALDYKEKDKLLELFSLENGKLTVSLKGVRSPKAKLKFAGEPLNLVEYTLVNRNGKYTVTGASFISSFFTIAQNYSNFLISCVVLEILNKVTVSNEPNSELFVLALKVFNELQQNESSGFVVLTKFYLEVLKILGFAIKFDNCLNCSKELSLDAYFSFDYGSLVCENCKSFYDVLITKNGLNFLKDINSCALENLSEINIMTDIKSLINILNKNLEMRCFISIKSFAQLSLL